MFDIIADSLIDNAMFFFGDRIEFAMKSSSYASSQPMLGSRTRKGKNDSIFNRLPIEFTDDIAYKNAKVVKGVGAQPNAVRMMLKNWVKQGLIEPAGEGNYRKC